MADVQPLRALHYDLEKVGTLGDVVSPPYDVIDPAQRERLQARSPHNVVAIDLPVGDDPYVSAARTLEEWIGEGAVVRDDEPAIWAIEQDYAAPSGGRATRRGFLARVRVEDYGAGRIRPHERTHPGPKEDRLNLTRATKANLSPIFSLYSDPSNAGWAALEPFTAQEPWGEATDDQGTVNRVWRVTDPDAVAAVTEALRDAELLIADGHHRYETARAYAEEIGGEGEHRYVLMCLVALEDPGLLIFPTHRLVRDLGESGQIALRDAIRRDFDVAEVTREELAPPQSGGPLQLGYYDGFHRTPHRLTLKDQSIADAALEGRSDAYRRLDTAIVEALMLEGALGKTEESISHFEGVGYARDFDEALALVDSGEFEAAFLLPGAPVSQVREIAAAGENMPPKSTFFHPKLPTGLLFNPLDGV